MFDVLFQTKLTSKTIVTHKTELIMYFTKKAQCFSQTKALWSQWFSVPIFDAVTSFQNYTCVK